MRILVADDDPVIRAIVTTGLKANGHQVSACTNGEDAWDRFCQEPYPMIITDWSMPALDGIELTRRIRALAQQAYTYVIMLTVNVRREHYLAAVKAGVDAFLAKPVDGAILEAQVTIGQRILGRESYIRQLEARLKSP